MTYLPLRFLAGADRVALDQHPVSLTERRSAVCSSDFLLSVPRIHGE